MKMKLSQQKNLKNLEWLDVITKDIEKAIEEVEAMLAEGLEEPQARRAARVLVQLRHILDLSIYKYNENAVDAASQPSAN